MCTVNQSRIPVAIPVHVGNTSGKRFLWLRGVSVADIQQLFAAKGDFQATSVDWECLVEYYDGNPLILGILARTIQHLFHGNITDFLGQKTLIFGPIRELLDQQVGYLSGAETEVLKTLAAYNTPLSFTELRLSKAWWSQTQISPFLSATALLESVNALKLRSLINITATQLALPPFLRDYIYERFELASLQLSNEQPHRQSFVEMGSDYPTRSPAIGHVFCVVPNF